MKIDSSQKILCGDILYRDDAYQDFKSICCDTETVQGKAWTIQFNNGDNLKLIYCNQTTILDAFLDYIKENFKFQQIYWFFFIQFDLPIIFNQYQQLFMKDDFVIQNKDFKFQFICGKTWFVNCSYKGKPFFIRDAYQYLYRSLDKSCKDLQIDSGKMNKPSWLGDRKWKNEKEKIYFQKYAIQDVISLWNIVKWIENIHKKYDVSFSVSLADLCGKIFRKHYFYQDEIIKIPPKDILYWAMQSYHGGKTQCYVKTPVKIHNVYEYDIKSAYPFAMISIPNFFKYDIDRVKNVSINNISEHGIYNITGQINCKYKGLFNNEYQYEEVINKQWVTGYELLSVNKFKEFKGIINLGIQIKYNENWTNHLTDYVWDFFKGKDTATNETERLWYKLALNALYGKFIARIELEDQTLRGGALFNPLVATMITGFIRAYCHDIEHTLDVYHTSTDSFITKNPNGELLYKGINNLGALKKQYFGDVMIFRRKLYFILDKNGIIQKKALHGFYADSESLLNMFNKKTNYYQIKKMVRLKEAFISRDPDIIPFLMRTRKFKLNINWNDYYEIH